MVCSKYWQTEAISPYSLRRLMRADIAGVAMMAFCPTNT